jgi:hypothetical protein
MPWFRKKPFVVEAWKWDGKTVPPGADMWMGDGGGWLIATIDGRCTVEIGAWIIKGTQGEFYPCKPEIFSQIYEPVEAPVG